MTQGVSFLYERTAKKTRVEFDADYPTFLDMTQWVALIVSTIIKWWPQ